MIRKVSLAAIALLSCTAAVGASDNRIRTLTYDPNEIVRIVGRAGIQSTIEFAPDERIENVAVGDSSAWQITPNRRASLLFVKPLTSHSRTNMTVVTDRRTYMFDLVAGDKSAAALYALKFSYPNAKVAEPVSKPVQQFASSPAATTPPQAIATAERLHFDWKSKGYGKLLPAKVFDDGSSLYLSWTRETPLPAILTISDDHKEGPVNFRMSGEYIVVSPIPANLVLRYGSKSATLWPTRHITPAPTPTVTPNVVTGRIATATAAPAQPPASQPVVTSQVAPPPQPVSTNSSLKLANVTSLYSDKLTDADHER